MPTTNDPHPGLVLAERYRLERELGRGGMGSVWRATHLTLRSHVAIKLLSANVSVKDAESRFLQEARAAAGLNNPHVVHLSDFGVHDGLPFLVMELLEGETLATRLLREGRLTPAVTALVFAQLGRGVSVAHTAGVVHRDLKPENVFLVDSGHELLVKVLDFGVAKTLHEQASARANTETGTTIGTVPYMAPEQIADSKRVGVGADVWSLGVIAFECLLGRRPFRGDNVATLVYDICHSSPPLPSSVGEVPNGFDEWFRRATAREPSQRWGSADDACAELVRACGGALPIAAGPAPKTLPTRQVDAPSPARTTGNAVWSEAATSRSARRPIVAAVALAVLIAGGALIAGSLGVFAGADVPRADSGENAEPAAASSAPSASPEGHDESRVAPGVGERKQSESERSASIDDPTVDATHPAALPTAGSVEAIPRHPEPTPPNAGATPEPAAPNPETDTHATDPARSSEPRRPPSAPPASREPTPPRASPTPPTTNHSSPKPTPPPDEPPLFL